MSAFDAHVFSAPLVIAPSSFFALTANQRQFTANGNLSPEGDLNVSGSGPISILCAVFFQLAGTPSGAQSGEPYLQGGINIATAFQLAGTPSGAQSGEPYLQGAATEIAVDPTITMVAPVGVSISTQQKYSARVSLPTSKGTITRIIINVEFPTGTSEEAFIDGAFTADYNGQSTIVQSSPGVFDITMIRNGGWPSSPRIRLHANTDRGGMTQ